MTHIFPTRIPNTGINATQNPNRVLCDLRTICVVVATQISAWNQKISSGCALLISTDGINNEIILIVRENTESHNANFHKLKWNDRITFYVNQKYCDITNTYIHKVSTASVYTTNSAKKEREQKWEWKKYEEKKNHNLL